MKTFKLNKPILVGCLILGMVGLLAPTLSSAEGKGASKLMSPTPTAQVQAAKTTHMACCADAYVKVADTSAKGMNAGATKAVPTHMCPSCQTKIVSVGTGKAKTDSVIHSCGNNAVASTSCCSTTK
jgi:hypothetical protein